MDSDDLPDDPILAAIGVVVIRATEIELGLIQTVRRATGKNWTWGQAVLSRPGGARNEFRTLVTSGLPPDQQASMAAFKDRAEDLLRRRNALVHGLTVRIFDENGRDQGHGTMNVRDGTITKLDYEQLAELAREMAQLDQDLRAFRRQLWAQPPDG
jgi:hypothetical protein